MSGTKKKGPKKKPRKNPRPKNGGARKPANLSLPRPVPILEEGW